MENEKALRIMRVRYGQTKRMIEWGIVAPLILCIVLSILMTIIIRSYTDSIAFFGLIVFILLAVFIGIATFVYSKAYSLWKCIYCEEHLFGGKIIVFQTKCPYCQKKLR